MEDKNQLEVKRITSKGATASSQQAGQRASAKSKKGVVSKSKSGKIKKDDDDEEEENPYAICENPTVMAIEKVPMTKRFDMMVAWEWRLEKETEELKQKLKMVYRMAEKGYTPQISLFFFEAGISVGETFNPL